jgi:tetratricopeptide (TPR) repeat protein
MKQRIAVLAGLIVVLLTAHIPVFRAGFVWDDTALVLRDPLIRSWRLIPEGFQHFLFLDATASNFYRPLQRLTYAMEYWACIFNPTPYHVTNVLLHAVASVALFAFALALLRLYGIAEQRRLIVASISTAAWALHPVHSAVVDYVAGRADSLAAIFGFVGLYFAIRALALEGRAAWKFHALTAVALLASALSKESGLNFAVLWIALLLQQRRWRALVPASTAIAFTFTIYFSLRMQAGDAQVPRLTPPAPLLVRPIIAARAIAEYAGLLIAPINLRMDRDVESHPWGFSEASMAAASWRELQTVAGVALFGTIVIWLVRVRKRNPATFMLLILAMISYLPICGLFALNATVAEHWIYLPSAFLVVALVNQFAQMTNHRNDLLLWKLATVVSLWIALLSMRTFFRAEDWKDQRTFLERTIATGSDSTRMLINLAALEISDGHLDRAESLLRRALAKEPGQPFALVNLATVALKKNDLTTARNLIEQARKNPVSEAQAQEILVAVENRQDGEIDLARLRLAAHTGPPAWPIERRYVRALDENGRTGGAVAELKAVLQIDWYRAESWQLLSACLAKLDRKSEAALALAEARAYDVHLGRH